MDVSLVIPVYNEEESLHPLIDWISKTLSTTSLSYEVIFVDDGSSDKSWEIIKSLKSKMSDQIKGLRFRRNYGKAAALNHGFELAEGEVIITMDACYIKK